MNNDYTTPQIVDHGDLKDLTAAKVAKTLLDGNFNAGTNVITDPVTTSP